MFCWFSCTPSYIGLFLRLIFTVSLMCVPTHPLHFDLDLIPVPSCKPPGGLSTIVKPHLLLLRMCCVFGCKGGLAPPTLNAAIFRLFLILCTKLSSEIACHSPQDLNGSVFMISFIGSKARGWAGIKTVRESGMPQWVRITVTTDKTRRTVESVHNG